MWHVGTMVTIGNHEHQRAHQIRALADSGSLITQRQSLLPRERRPRAMNFSALTGH
jgi:hypothetical protein